MGKTVDNEQLTDNREWKELKLGDISDFKNGKKIIDTDRDEMSNYFIYGSNGIIGKTDKVLYKENTIIIGRVGIYCGSIEISKNKCWITDNAIACISKDTTNARYLYYLLKTLGLNQRAGGSAQPLLNQGLLKNITVKVPSIEEQQKIASILKSLDDKIELNNQMNATLEEMAQSIFKEWFVEFNFPNEEGVPYKDNGGEMVESELGEIPEGWRIEEFYNIAEFINGKAFKGKDYCETSKDLPIIKIVELKSGITDQTRYSIKNIPEKYFLENGDILFSWSGNPDTSLDAFIWTLGEAVLNQHIFKVNITQLSKGLTYTILKYHMQFFKEMARNKQTTGLGHVTVKNLREYKITLPDDETLKEFEGIYQNFFEKILSVQLENEVLIKTRDELLPKLMSGEVRV